MHNWFNFFLSLGAILSKLSSFFEEGPTFLGYFIHEELPFSGTIDPFISLQKVKKKKKKNKEMKEKL